MYTKLHIFNWRKFLSVEIFLSVEKFLSVEQFYTDAVGSVGD